MKKRIFVFLTSLCMMCCMMLMPVQVSAYTAIDGYPFKLYEEVSVYNYPSGNLSLGYIKDYSVSDNVYTFINSNTYSNVGNLRFGAYSTETNEIPFDLDNYDYYFVGNLYFADSNILNSDFTVSDVLQSMYFYSAKGTVNMIDANFMPFYSYAKNDGVSFYGKINLDPSSSSNTNLTYLFFDFADNSFSFSGNVTFSASFVPVAKGTEAEQVNQAILEELVKINQNLVTQQALQQSTTDAINQHDANEKSWFQQLIQSIGVGFSALLDQMTKEQDEQLNGYEGSAAADANEEFSAGSSELTAIEGQLTDDSGAYVDDFTATGFDAGILATLGNSMTFVVTWFTNFWNMGGLFTSALTLCFAVSIAFFILKLKR